MTQLFDIWPIIFSSLLGLGNVEQALTKASMRILWDGENRSATIHLPGRL